MSQPATTAPLDARTFADLLTSLHLSRFSGAITLHFAGGVPKVVVFPGPQIRLGATPTQGRLDTASAVPEST